jgi:CxxC motif-containing protein (DUF1111 family)
MKHTKYPMLVATTALVAGACGAPPDESVGESHDALTASPLPGLTTAQLGAFNDGEGEFNNVETVHDGLGPVFNEKSCGSCHNIGATGGTGVQFEVRAGRLVNGVFDSLVSQGGQLFQLFGVGGQIPGCNVNGEVVPSNANVQAKRRTTALFGLGLVDATPDSTFTGLASSEPSGIRGRVNTVQNIAAGRNTDGKFGWKAQVPTLHQFSGDAYLNEMGITNPEFPNENPPQGNASLIAPCDLVPGLEDDGGDVQAFTDFMRFLAPAPTATRSAQAQAGDPLFTQVGCDGCHTRTLTSGSNAVAALSQKTYHPFSDFLLHDMGSLGDNIGGQGQAGLREMRTAPLWALRFANPNNLLHDGRAHSYQDAILMHAGQAQASRDAFNALSTTNKQNLVEFIKTL